MKQLLITIAAVVLVGCGPSVPDMNIHKAAITGDIEAVKQYLDAGGDVNAKDEATTFPLYYAAMYGHKEIVELLIANGADVNLRSGMVVKTEDGSDGEQAAQEIMNNKTALDMAYGSKHMEVVDLLRKHGGKTGAELKAEENETLP